ncbi:MAG: hypothetical protein HC796_10385 [Synechococcaceae cyanobacterium RL_1_2]|nr:hypothetical protein [Synechococcaceae cyanobacterium RL_1_2]
MVVFFSGVVVAGIGMALNPDGFDKFFSVAEQIPPSTSSLSYYWDVNAYAELVLNPQCSAFYPLWPALIRAMAHPQNIHEAAYMMGWVSRLLWIISLPLTILVFRQGLNHHRVAFICVLLYSLSPFSIFRVIGYTESLFAILSLGLIYVCGLVSDRNPTVLGNTILVKTMFGGAIGILGCLISLTRPTLVQIIGASVATLITLWLVSYGKNLQSLASDSSRPRAIAYIKTTSMDFVHQHRSSLFISFCLIGGAIIGYSIYGYFCLHHSGDFFGPFNQQKAWNKSFGFRPWLLFTSKSPLQDLLGLYFPGLLWLIAIGNLLEGAQVYTMPRLDWGKISCLLQAYPPLWVLYQSWHHYRDRQNQLAITKHDSPDGGGQPRSFRFMESYIFWFSLYFSFAHSAIVLLTQDRLVSLGRYIFGQPFIFLALGYLFIDLRHYLKPQQRTFLCLHIDGMFYGFINRTMG